MKKLVLILLFLSSISYAKELQEYTFLGLNYSKSQFDISNQTSQKDMFSIQYGKQSTDYRTTFGFDYNKDYQSLTMELDMILLDEMFHTPKLRPYIGFRTGTVRIKNSGLSDDSGYFYGGSFGFIIYANDNLDIDISYNYNIVQEVTNFDNVQNISLSIHYFL